MLMLEKILLLLAVSVQATSGCVYKDQTIKVGKGQSFGLGKACSISGRNSCYFAAWAASVNNDVWNVTGVAYPKVGGKPSWKVFAETTAGPFGPDNFDHRVINREVVGSGGTYISLVEDIFWGCVQPGNGGACEIVIKEMNQCEGDGSGSCPLESAFNESNMVVSPATLA